MKNEKNILNYSFFIFNFFRLKFVVSKQWLMMLQSHRSRLTAHCLYIFRFVA